MENQPNKTKKILLIAAILVVLAGGGFAIWSVTKKEDSTMDSSTAPKDDQPKVDSRKDKSGLFQLTPEVIEHIKGLQDDSFSGKNNGGGKPLFIKDKNVQDMIKAKAKRLQSNPAAMDLIRAKYRIGNSMIKNERQRQLAIDSLFAQFDGADFTTKPETRYLQYPIFGTYEEVGLRTKKQLEALLKRDPKGFSLSSYRHGDKPWWISAISVNLLVGTRVAATPPHQDFWWGHHGAQLDFFKRMNGVWNHVHEIVDGKTNGVPWFYAGGVFEFVETWLRAIERLDLVTEWEAIRTLSAPKEKGGDGVLITYIDPKTKVDLSSVYDPGDNATNDEKDPLIKV